MHIQHHESTRRATADRARAGAALVRPTRMAAAAALCAALGSVSVAAHAQAQPEWVKGRVLVMPHAGLAEADLGKIVGSHGGQARQIGSSRIYIVDLPAAASETAVQQQLAHNPHLKFAELDRRVPVNATPNDPYTGSEWHLSKIGVPAALDIATGAGVTIAILDTGTNCTHPDLAPNCVAGWNFVTNDSNTADVHGHGTQTAGTAAAATNNGVGVASVSGQSKIMPIRVADATGYASFSAIAQGITYAADHGARVASISIDQVAGSAACLSAAQYMKGKGGLVVVAAGNTGTQLGFAQTTSLIPVSATDSNDVIASWSSFGSYVAMSAPGVGIWTTTAAGGYAAVSGTSFATPTTAGAIALMMSARPALANTQIESLLYSTAVGLGASGRDIYYGYGRVNAAAAVQAAAAATSTVDSVAPTAAISAPLGSSTVSGLVPVSVSAADNVGVTKVELRVNGATVATDTASPYAFSWDSTRVANGMASLTAVAYDAAGHATTSTAVAVNVANVTTTTIVSDTAPPVVAFTSPKTGSIKGKGGVTVTTSASDNNGSAGITQTLYVDGVLAASVTGASLTYSWNVTKLATGAHTLKVVATDAAKNAATTSIQISK